jgi:hypothetical protein
MAEVVDAPEHNRFELRDGDEVLGWLDYLPAGDSVILAHTEVPEPNEGRGLGGTLVRGALERLAQDGKTALPTCPFASAHIRRHPELARYVDPSLRSQFASG